MLKGATIHFYLSSVYAAGELHVGCIQSLLKRYHGRYSDISKYFKNTFPKHPLFCVGPILSTSAGRIKSQILQPHLGQGMPPSLHTNGVPKFIHPSTQVPIFLVAGGYMI